MGYSSTRLIVHGHLDQIMTMFSQTSHMRKCYGGVIIAAFLFIVLVLRYGVNSTFDTYLSSSFSYNSSSTNLGWTHGAVSTRVHDPGNSSKVVSVQAMIAGLFDKRNLSNDEKLSLQTWIHLKNLVSQPQMLPNAVEAIKEAGSAWHTLMTSVEEDRNDGTNQSSRRMAKEKQCPSFLSKMNATELDDKSYKLRVPCGLTQGSSITVIGIPNGLVGNFRIDLTAEPLPGEPDPPIILHYNVRLHGDKLTDNPVIVQNTWTLAQDWGEEERCPSPSPENIKKVDELDQCNNIVGKDYKVVDTRRFKGSNQSSVVGGTRRRTYFPFKQNILFVATLRVGSEGIQMTVDGKHITSFAYRETLEPWLVSEMRISGDLQLISILASGLPTSEDVDHVVDIEALKSAVLPLRKPLDLLIGVFSTANNFKRRMAVRRTWMQYDAVRTGTVAVRFFVGLHKSQMVNEELWNEARTYRDMQLMPFVDYYNLITWKTLAICIFGTEVVSAKFVMKTDDDSFVRVDEVLTSLERVNVTGGLLYGLIHTDSHPDRNPESKWFVSNEEWSEDAYPPWANGPGYVVSHDIAKDVFKRHKRGLLKMFKLEDVGMGMWIADMQKGGLEVRYEQDERIISEGCKDNYVVAHYQSPREMLCLWQKLQDLHRAKCCGEE